MSVGVPGPRGTLGHNIPTSPQLKFSLDPNDPTVRARPLSEALAEAEQQASYYESTLTKPEKRLTSKDEDGCKEEDSNAHATRPRSLLKRLLRLF